jgi:predicted RNA-binding Zn-ribbon protein involved in translation (DUF1610 family)
MAISMRYDRHGRELLCGKCLGTEGREMPVPRTQIESNPERQMMSYQCGSCSFGFTRNKGIDVSSCPYCGNNSVRLAFRGSAQRIIEESQRELL